MAQNGAKRMPPALAPLSAWPNASGRRWSNHGETIAMMAAPLVTAQPAPLRVAATNSCHGAAANDQPTMPITRANVPAWVTVAMPNLR
jgi:hypothetical protein